MNLKWTDVLAILIICVCILASISVWQCNETSRIAFKQGLLQSYKSDYDYGWKKVQ